MLLPRTLNGYGCDAPGAKALLSDSANRNDMNVLYVVTPPDTVPITPYTRLYVNPTPEAVNETAISELLPIAITLSYDADGIVITDLV
jgi:hypothetical protein